MLKNYNIKLKKHMNSKTKLYNAEIIVEIHNKIITLSRKDTIVNKNFNKESLCIDMENKNDYNY